MSEKPQANYLLIIKEKIMEIIKESKNLTMPTMRETILKTIIIMIICCIMTGFLLLIGEIVVKGLSLII